jgi:hypothetical protein
MEQSSNDEITMDEISFQFCTNFVPNLTNFANLPSAVDA